MAKLEHLRGTALVPLCLDREGIYPIPGTSETVDISLPPAAVWGNDGTINQEGLGDACGLAVSRRFPNLLSPDVALGRMAKFLALQVEFGHQCRGTGYDDDECWPPAPHGDLHEGYASGALYEVVHHGPKELFGPLVNWWAVHLLGVQPFWTVGHGFAAPCGRALSLLPQWPFTNRAYALIVLGEDGKAAADRYGKLMPASSMIFDLLRACGPRAFPEIRDRMSNGAVLLRSTPIRKWSRPGGGYIAALLWDSKLIDHPCGWVEVDGDGVVVKSGRLLASFLPPEGEPEVIGRGNAIWRDQQPDAPEVPIQSAPAALALADQLKALAVRVHNLKLARDDRPVQDTVEASLKEAASSKPSFANLAALVERFGIGPGQPQKVEQLTIVAELRHLATVDD